MDEPSERSEPSEKSETGASGETGESARQRRSRFALAALLLVMGVLHFVAPKPFDRLIPGWLPLSERFWTYASGVGELACGTLLLVPRTKRLGAWCSLALFVAVYPGNLTMAWRAGAPHDLESWAAWLRLPLQVPLWWWAWSHTRTRTPGTNSTKLR